MFVILVPHRSLCIRGDFSDSPIENQRSSPFPPVWFYAYKRFLVAPVRGGDIPSSILHYWGSTVERKINRTRIQAIGGRRLYRSGEYSRSSKIHRNVDRCVRIPDILSRYKLHSETWYSALTPPTIKYSTRFRNRAVPHLAE